MKILSIQIQNAAQHRQAIQQFTDAIQTTTPKIKHDTEHDVIHISIASDQPKDILHTIQQAAQNHSAITNNWIVVCEGTHGWADYLLLAHHDAKQILDTLV